MADQPVYRRGTDGKIVCHLDHRRSGQSARRDRRWPIPGNPGVADLALYRIDFRRCRKLWRARTGTDRALKRLTRDGGVQAPRIALLLAALAVLAAVRDLGCD